MLAHLKRDLDGLEQNLTDKTDDIEAVYAAVQGVSHSLMGKMSVDPLVVAAVLASTALSIYKTTLSPQDFDDIVDAIANSRDNVKRIPTLDYYDTDPTVH